MFFKQSILPLLVTITKTSENYLHLSVVITYNLSSSFIFIVEQFICCTVCFTICKIATEIQFLKYSLLKTELEKISAENFVGTKIKAMFFFDKNFAIQ